MTLPPTPPAPPTPPVPPWEPTPPGVPAGATAEQLAELAASSPELWPEISAHPNCYDGLRAWIAEHDGSALSPGLVSGFPGGDATAVAGSFEEATRTVAAGDFEQTMAASEFERTTVAPEFQQSTIAAPDQPLPPGIGAVPGQMPPPVGGWMPPAANTQHGAPMPPPPAPMPPFGMPAPLGAAGAAGAAPGVPPFGSTPMGGGPIPFNAAPDQGPRPKSKSRAKVWIAAGVAAALVVSGGGVALALTDTWPFGEGGIGDGGAAASKVAEETSPTFAGGIEEKWSVTGSDFGAGSAMLGHMPRMMPNIAQREREDRPMLIEGSVLFSYDTDSAQSMTGWAAIDPETGLEQWSSDSEGRRSSCATDATNSTAVCSMTARSGPGEMVQLDSTGVKTLHDFGANWESNNRVWFEGDDIALVDREGYRVMSNTGDFDQSASVSKPSGKPLFSVDNSSSAENGCGWLIVDGTVSYFGDVCSEESKEIASDASSFEWAVVNGQSPRIIVNEADQVTAIDAASREILWTKSGTLPGWYQAPQVVPREAGDGVLVYSEGKQRVSIVDIETGEEVTISTSASDRHIAISAGEVLAFSGNSERSLSAVEVFDGETGEEIYSGSFPEVTQVAEVFGGPNGVMFSHYFCDDCTTAEGSHSLDRYTFMGPASAHDNAARPAGSVSIPESISVGCPVDTILLAWAEFADGWVLVCGVSKTEPTFMAYQGPESSKVLYSVGAQNPTGADAKASVDWDAALSRYSAELEGGDRVTLDYDIGTAVRRDSVDRKTIEQQRFVRYIFVPMGETVRTMTDASQQDGAFDVQAPDDTADDQVRYMIEVLEKAYAGRALVKDALPKLEYCTASAGGYSDTVSAMKAVRDNRAELLSSLDAMPVDKIPEGSALLDDLYEAIEASHRANIEYVAWAEAANASGCASLSSAGARAASDSDRPKERFASRWNRVVAPKFGVRTFDAWYI